MEDEVVRGSAITYKGEKLPPIPRAMPPPPPPTPEVKAEEIKALTPWQKVSRDVAVITGGMGGTSAPYSIKHIITRLIVSQLLSESLPAVYSWITSSRSVSPV
jgi:hypothetical protein